MMSINNNVDQDSPDEAALEKTEVSEHEATMPSPTVPPDDMHEY